MSNPALITDNRVINGDFVIDQRNAFAASTPAATAYVCDKWKAVISGLGSDITFQIQSTVALPPFLNALKCLNAATGAPTAAQFYLITQQIEASLIADLGWGTNNAQPVWLTFKARASVTGTYYVSLTNSFSGRSYVIPYVIGTANQWTSFAFLVPGDTSAAAWNTLAGTPGITIGFDLGCGSNFNAAATQAWQAANVLTAAGAVQLVNNAAATLYLANITLTKGLVQPVGYIPRPMPLERELCRRYFQTSFPEGTAPAQSGGVAGSINVKNPIAVGDPSHYVQLQPNMCTSPALTTFNPSASNANWRNITQSSDATVSVDPATAKSKTGFLLATSGTDAALGDILAIHYTADADL